MKGTRDWVVFALGLGLASACVAQTTAPPASPLAEECKEKGGVVMALGMMHTPTCVVMTRDAGKSCRGKADCEVACLYAGLAPPVKGKDSKEYAGVCAKDNNLYGCRMFVENGAVSGICLN